MQSQAFMRQSEAEVSHGLLCNVCCLFCFFFGCSLFFCHSAIPIILQPQPQALCKNKCNLSPLALALSKMCNPTAHLPGLWFATTNPRPLVQRWALGIYSARITKANIHPCRWIQFYFCFTCGFEIWSAWDIPASTKIPRSGMGFYLWHLTEDC